MISNDLFRVGNVLRCVVDSSDKGLQVLVTKEVSDVTFSGIVLSDTRRVMYRYDTGHFSSSWLARYDIWELVGSSSNHNEKYETRRIELANELERYNRWRRGAEDIEPPNPTELGVLIDEIVKELRK